MFVLTLDVSDLNKTFYQGSNVLPILKDVLFSLDKGEVVALLGPSGSGKTTFLQIIGLLEKADTGQITINQTECAHASDKKRTLIRRNQIGFIYQFHHLLPEFSALENLIIPQMINGKRRKEARERAYEYLDYVHLKNRADHRPARLSGGEQQRVAIARALINNPALILADEPTGNLDPETAGTVFDLLVQTVKYTESSALIATHNYDLARKMDRVVELKNGSLVHGKQTDSKLRAMKTI